MPIADKAGFPTHWTTFGEGAEQALMIHCSLAHSGSWSALARELSDTLTMTAFDMPGHGRSGDWDARGEYQAVTASVAADFLTAPSHIIAHSYGATVALRLAVDRPELVRSLALYEPVFFAAAFADKPALRVDYERRMAAFLGAMDAGDYAKAAQSFTGTWGDQTPWEDIPKVQRDLLCRQMPLIEAGSGAIYDDTGGLLSPNGLEAIEAPIMLMEGATSPSIIAEINAAIMHRVPQASRAVVPGAGHMGPISHPKLIGERISSFLSETQVK